MPRKLSESGANSHALDLESTKTIPRFWAAKSCLKLVFATLMQASEGWQNVGMGEVEVAMLKHLRRELGLEPPATSGRSVPQRPAV